MNALQEFFYALKVALMNEDDIPDIPPAELDMAIDEDNKSQGRGPERRTAEQGIKDMQARITYLKKAIFKLDELFLGQQLSPEDVLIIHHRKQELAEAEQRLAEYQTQLKGKN